MPVIPRDGELPVPLPSPIPRGKGSRCAANDMFCEFLEKKARRVPGPELTLPESHFPAMMHTLVPADIDCRTLSSPATVNLLVRSAKEFGSFRISNHGISGQELGMVEEEAERALKQERRGAISRGNVVVERNKRSGEIILCVHSHRGTLRLSGSKLFGLQSHRHFWIQMENIASRLVSILEQVSVALQEHKPKEFKERIRDTESVVCLCRYPYGNESERNEGASSNEKNERLNDHALHFYLPMEHCIFYVQSGRGPLSFDAGPETIVVTVGKHLQEWSKGEFKSVPGEMIFMPSSQCSQASFSIELKFFHSSKKSDKIISLTDQILVVVCLSFLYNFLLFLFSY